MRVLYDHQIFSNQFYGGISRYFYELIKEVNTFQETKTKISLFLSNNSYLSEEKIAKYYSFFPEKNSKRKKLFLHRVNKIISILFLKYYNFDIFHPTYYDPYFLKYIKSKPFVLTVYDMINEKLKGNYGQNKVVTERKKKLVARAVRIIAISENTKRDLIDLFGTEESKIEVVYLANSLNRVKKIESNMKLPDKYILFVGSRKGYKNFIGFIKSISELIVKEKNLKIFCAGGGSFNKKELKLFDELNIIDRIFQKNLNDDKLAFCYKNAELFVFPSLYEGFGIPILESFACECPLVCSNGSSFPEIAKEGAVYFNPNDQESIKKAVDKVLKNDYLKIEMIKKGKEILKNFSWEKTAKETEKVYKKVLNN